MGEETGMLPKPTSTQAFGFYTFTTADWEGTEEDTKRTCFHGRSASIDECKEMYPIYFLVRNPRGTSNVYINNAGGFPHFLHHDKLNEPFVEPFRSSSSPTKDTDTGSVHMYMVLN